MMPRSRHVLDLTSLGGNAGLEALSKNDDTPKSQRASVLRFGLSTLLGAIALFAVLFFLLSRHEKPQAWEYEAVEMPATSSKLADYGKDGWELVAVVQLQKSPQAVFYFKRVKK